MSLFPKVSIIAPVYNVERYLQKCIESLLNQTLKDIEIILVDDGSTDLSGSICDDYALKNKKIRVLHQENSGVSIARKNGTMMALGEFIMYVDSDDYLDVKACEIAFKEARDSEADVVMFSYFRDYANRKIQAHVFAGDKTFNGDEVKALQRRIVGMVGEELRAPYMYDSLSPMYMKLINRNLIINNKISFVDSKKVLPGEDTVFNVELFNYAKRVKYLDVPLYYYRREVSTSATGSFNVNYFERWLNHLILIKEYIAANNLGIEFVKAFDNRICCEFIGISMKEANPVNPRKFSQKVSHLKSILNHELYIKPFKNLDIKYMPIHWRLFFWLCKKQQVIGVYFMAKAMRAMRSKA